MSGSRGIHRILGCLIVIGLSGCILAPIGDDRGGGREHEDREHHDHDEEHRHDFGVNQGERLGFYQPYATRRGAPVPQPAVLVRNAVQQGRHGIWA